jgi:hypothetical protein
MYHKKQAENVSDLVRLGIQFKKGYSSVTLSVIDTKVSKNIQKLDPNLNVLVPSYQKNSENNFEELFSGV